MPKWSTPDRRTVLLRLWGLYGNRCLLGHVSCPDPQHYVDYRPIVLTVPIPYQVRCQDRHGNPIRNEDGNQLYLTLYKYDRGIVYEVALSRLYDKLSNEHIAHWKSEDREARAYERKMLRRSMHHLNERGSVRGTFNAISRTIYHDSQAQSYFEGLGISGLTFRPFAKVRLASSFMRLHVDISEPMRKLSKNKRRKVVRYAKSLPIPIQGEVDKLIANAVRDYLNRR